MTDPLTPVFPAINNDSAGDSHLSAATIAVAAGRPEPVAGAPVNPPVEFTSTYVAGGRLSYTRMGNGTFEALEATMGALEGGTAVSFASGIAAIAAAVELLPVGGILVTCPVYYAGSRDLFEHLAQQGRIELRVHDFADLSGLEQACVGASGVWAETPTNPLMEHIDIPQVARIARAAGALVFVDNTLLTPILARPLDTGADVVVHSATKYLAGHSDVLLGVVCTRDEDLHAQIVKTRTLHGAIPGPMEAWLTLRGVRTLAVRMKQACANAQVLAERLSKIPLVQRVRYPGYGAMLAFDAVSVAAADAVQNETRLWTAGTSLGGVESLIERRRRHDFESKSVPEELVRLSVGIEDIEDLWADLIAVIEKHPH